jgi:aspartate 4-decarboxylase
VKWLAGNTKPSALLFQRQGGASRVLAATRFRNEHRSRGISLANLNESDYRKIGRPIWMLMDDYMKRYNEATGGYLEPGKTI